MSIIVQASSLKKHMFNRWYDCGHFPQVPESEMGYWHPYELVIRGYDGNSVVFSNSTFLKFSPRSSSTFIQTDKPNYKPGQVVKIRAVSIHPDGRPFESQVDMVIKVCVF